MAHPTGMAREAQDVDAAVRKALFVGGFLGFVIGVMLGAFLVGTQL